MRNSGEAPSAPPRRGIARRDLAALLAPTVSLESADELVASTARSLGFLRLDAFDANQATAIFRALGAVEGVVGTAARIAMARKDFAALTADASNEGPASRAPGAAWESDDAPPSTRSGVHPHGVPSSRRSRPDGLEAAGPASVGRVSVNTLVDLLSHSASKDEARAAVSECATRLGLGDLILLDVAQAGAILDEIAKSRGSLALIARFAKARFLLRHSPQ